MSFPIWAVSKSSGLGISTHLRAIIPALMRETLEGDYGDPYGIVGNVLVTRSSPGRPLQVHLHSDNQPRLGLQTKRTAARRSSRHSDISRDIYFRAPRCPAVRDLQKFVRLFWTVIHRALGFPYCPQVSCGSAAICTAGKRNWSPNGAHAH